MRFDNRFRDRQAHTRALDAIPLISPSIEFFEDVVDFRCSDPWTLVRNTDGVKSTLFLCRDRDGLAR
jgi:hypothetical protein